MKMIKKLTTLCIALFILFTCAMPTMAQGEKAPTEEHTGTITYNTGSHNVDGNEFKIYRLMDATVNPNTQASPDGSNPLVAYTISSKFKGFFTEELLQNITDDEDNKTLDLKAQEYLKDNVSKSEFHNQLKGYINKADALVEADLACTVNNGTFTTEKLPYGYYVIIPAEELNLGLTFTTLYKDSQDVYLKGVQPGVNKTIDADKVKDSAQIGDTINFTVKSTVPNMMGQTSYNFKLEDTLSRGLTFDVDSVKVTVGDKELKKNGVDNEFTVTKTENGEPDYTTSVVIEITNFITYMGYANQEIKFEYSAILNKDAFIDGTGNSNSAQVKYGNDGNILQSGTSTATVYTHQLTIKKQDRVETEGAIMLAGAEFKLYRGTSTTDEQNLVKFVDNKDGAYRVATANDTTTTNTLVSPEGGVDVKGIIKVSGLDAGEYRLVEIKAPAGYNKLKQPVTINIQTTLNQDGQTIEVSGNDPVVVNKAGTLLPETGGMGTVVFTVVGVVGILAVAYSFMPKKSKNK